MRWKNSWEMRSSQNWLSCVERWMIQSEVIFLCSKVRHARLICPPGFFWFFGCWFYFLRRYDELRVSHENATNCESLGGREEQTYGHISHLMSKKIRCTANCVKQLSPVKTRRAFTLCILTEPTPDLVCYKKHIKHYI